MIQKTMITAAALAAFLSAPIAAHAGGKCPFTGATAESGKTCEGKKKEDCKDKDACKDDKKAQANAGEKK